MKSFRTADRLAWGVVALAFLAGLLYPTLRQRPSEAPRPSVQSLPDVDLEAELGPPGVSRHRVHLVELFEGPDGWEVAVSAVAGMPSDGVLRFEWVHHDVQAPRPPHRRSRSTFRSPGLPPAASRESSISTTLDLGLGRLDDLLANGSMNRDLRSPWHSHGFSSGGGGWPIGLVGMPGGAMVHEETLSRYVTLARLVPPDVETAPMSAAAWRRAYAAGLATLADTVDAEWHDAPHPFRTSVDGQLEVALLVPMPEAVETLARFDGIFERRQHLRGQATSYLDYARLLAGDARALPAVATAFARQPETRPYPLHEKVGRDMYLTRLLIAASDADVRAFAERELVERDLLPVAARRLLDAEAGGRVALSEQLREVARRALVGLGEASDALVLPRTGSPLALTTLAIVVLLLVVHACGSEPRHLPLSAAMIALGLVAAGLRLGDPGWEMPTSVGGCVLAAVGARRLVRSAGTWGIRAWQLFVAAAILHVLLWATGLEAIGRGADLAMAVGFLFVAAFPARFLEGLRALQHARPQRPAAARSWRLAIPLGVGFLIAAAFFFSVALQLSSQGSVARGAQNLGILVAIALLVAAVITWRRSLRDGRTVRPLPPLLVVGYVAPVVLLQTAALVHGIRLGAGPSVPGGVRAVAEAWALCAVIGALVRLIDAARIRAFVDRSTVPVETS